MFAFFMKMFILLTVSTRAKMNIGASVRGRASVQSNVNVANLEDPFADLDDVFDVSKLVHITASVDVDVDATDVDAGATSKSFIRTVVMFILDLATVFLVIYGAHRCFKGDRSSSAACDDDSTRAGAAAEITFAPLIEAARIGDQKTWRQLLLQAPSIVYAEDCCCCTALHAAAHGGFTALMQDLLQHGAVADATDVMNETPLHLAARAGQEDAIKMLVDTCGAHIDAVSDEGHTPLLVAAYANKANACELLLDFGASVGEEDLSEEELPRLLEQLFAHRFMKSELRRLAA